jgi:hypothetical protein
MRRGRASANAKALGVVTDRPRLAQLSLAFKARLRCQINAFALVAVATVLEKEKSNWQSMKKSV